MWIPTRTIQKKIPYQLHVYGEGALVKTDRTVCEKLLNSRPVYSDTYGVRFRQTRAPTQNSRENYSVQRDQVSFFCGLTGYNCFVSFFFFFFSFSHFESTIYGLRIEIIESASSAHGEHAIYILVAQNVAVALAL